MLETVTLYGNISEISYICGSLNLPTEYIEPKTEQLTVEPKKEQQIFEPNVGKYYDKVTITPIPNEYIKPAGTLNVTSNGEYDVTNYEKTTVNVGTFEINDCKYLFYNGARLNCLNELLSVCKNVTSTENMFSGCYSAISNLDLTNFDTAQTTNMGNMFMSCNGLKTLNLTNVITENVTSMMNMFMNCNGLEELDLSSFDTKNVTDFRNMFSGCSKLMKLDIRNFTFLSYAQASNMFSRVPASCEIIVKDDIAKNWVLTQRSDFTNVKIVAEL